MKHPSEYLTHWLDLNLLCIRSRSSLPIIVHCEREVVYFYIVKRAFWYHKLTVKPFLLFTLNFWPVSSKFNKNCSCFEIKWCKKLFNSASAKPHTSGSVILCCAHLVDSSLFLKFSDNHLKFIRNSYYLVFQVSCVLVACFSKVFIFRVFEH